MSLLDDPLASAAVRLGAPPGGPAELSPWPDFQPLGLRHLVAVPPAPPPAGRYSHREQVTVDVDGRPLLDTVGGRAAGHVR